LGNRKEWLIVGLLFITAGLLVFSAFNPQEKAQATIDNELNIGILLRSVNDDYWNYVRKGADLAALEYDVKLQLHFPEHDGDIDGQIRSAMAMIEGNPDAIIIGANSDESFASVLKEAARRKIPVIAVDSQLTSGKVSSYIGSNNKTEGQRAMREMAKHLSYSGKILLVGYVNGGINGDLREQGVYEELEHYDGITLVDHIECSRDQEACKSQLVQLIELYEPDGILALNTISSVSSALAIKQINAAEKIKIVGFDSSMQLLELLQEGQLQSLFVQNPFSLGYLSVQKAVEAAKESTSGKDHIVQMTIVNKENMFWLKHQKLLFPVIQ